MIRLIAQAESPQAARVPGRDGDGEASAATAEFPGAGDEAPR